VSLDGERLQQTALDVARALPGVTEGHPFTKHLLVIKVAGRVFLIVTEDPDKPIITVKADPDHGAALIRDHEGIQRGRYFDKDHWVSVSPGRSITAGLVQDLVQDSYDLVADQLPGRQRDELRRQEGV